MGSKLDRIHRLRRVLILCLNFTESFGYVQGAEKSPRIWKEPPCHTAANFYIVAKNNALDICVLEWCKLFGDDKTKPGSWGEHFWKNVVSDPERFENELLAHLNTDAATFEKYRVDVMRDYRDKFVAHLDNKLGGHYPGLNLAQQAVEFFYGYIVSIEAGPDDDLDGLPVNVMHLRLVYDKREQEAVSVYSKLSDETERAA